MPTENGFRKENIHKTTLVCIHSNDNLNVSAWNKFITHSSTLFSFSPFLLHLLLNLFNSSLFTANHFSSLLMMLTFQPSACRLVSCQPSVWFPLPSTSLPFSVLPIFVNSQSRLQSTECQLFPPCLENYFKGIFQLDSVLASMPQ